MGKQVTDETVRPAVVIEALMDDCLKSAAAAKDVRYKYYFIGAAKAYLIALEILEKEHE